MGTEYNPKNVFITINGKRIDYDSRPLFIVKKKSWLIYKLKSLWLYIKYRFIKGVKI